MDVFNGTDFVLMVESVSGSYKPVAHASQHQLSVNRTIRPVSSKSSGDAEANEYGRYNYAVGVDGLKSYVTDIINYDWFLTAILAKTKVKILSVLLDYETAGKAPLADATAIVVRDAAGDDNIDSATTAIETTADNFAHTAVQSELTPKAQYGTCVIESVEYSAGDDDNPTFSVSLKGDGELQPFTIGAFS